MFSCLAVYLGERLVLVLANQEEPWNGILLPTSREFHQELMAKYSALHSHGVLGKWLYVSQTHPEFESLGNSLVEEILKGSSLVGVLSGTRARRAK